MTPPRTTRPPARRRPARGFTLSEVLITLAVALSLAAMAWPSQERSLQRARRADAITALTRVQFAQEQYRAHHGSYAPTLAALQGASAARSPEGLYDIQLLESAVDRVVVAAAARGDGPQAGDTDCARLTIDLNQGLADFGPSARCWNR